MYPEWTGPAGVGRKTAEDTARKDVASVDETTAPIIVIGDIMLDILIKPKGPIRSASDTNSDIRLGIGGAGANTAIHLARSGIPTTLLGLVGDDDLGRLAMSALQVPNLTAAVERIGGAPTGAIGIMVDHTGQRTMFPQRGANKHLDEDLVRRQWPRSVGGLVVSGYALFEPSTRAAARLAMELTKESGGTIAIDPASYAMIEDVGVDRWLRWTEGADIILPNRDEIRVIAKPTAGQSQRHSYDEGASTATGASLGVGVGAISSDFSALDASEIGPDRVDDESPLQVYESLLVQLTKKFDTVIVKLDADGAMGRTAGETVYVPARKVDVVDTTGAGDAFNAGFLAAYLAGRPMRTAIDEGHNLAAQVVQRLGAS